MARKPHQNDHYQVLLQHILRDFFFTPATSPVFGPITQTRPNQVLPISSQIIFKFPFWSPTAKCDYNGKEKKLERDCCWVGYVRAVWFTARTWPPPLITNFAKLFFSVKMRYLGCGQGARIHSNVSNVAKRAVAVPRRGTSYPYQVAVTSAHEHHVAVATSSTSASTTFAHSNGYFGV